MEKDEPVQEKNKSAKITSQQPSLKKKERENHAITK